MRSEERQALFQQFNAAWHGWDAQGMWTDLLDTVQFALAPLISPAPQPPVEEPEENI
jgi:hypothetical protein